MWLFLFSSQQSIKLLNVLIRIMINFHRHYHSLFIELNFLKFCFLLNRIKQRTIEEMEEDLSQAKVFDMTMQFKGMSLLLPANGVLYKLVNIHLIG